MWFSVSSAKQVLWSRSLPWLYRNWKNHTSFWHHVSYKGGCLRSMLIMPETATCVVWFVLDTLILRQVTSDGFDRWDASSQDKILLWNCWYMKMCLVLMHGYSTIKQIVMLSIMKNCLFELAFTIFSPFSALYSASLHQDLLQQFPSCTVFDSSPLIVLSVLNSTQSCSCHSCAGTVFKWGE